MLSEEPGAYGRSGRQNENKGLGGRRPLYLSKPMDRTRGNGGSLREFGAAGRMMTQRQGYKRNPGRKDGRSEGDN
jgi:hypothetical protein